MSFNLKETFKVTNPDAEKAKRIVCSIIQAAGGELRSATRLYKAFYAAHLIHWQQQTGVLSRYPIARMPNGPGIHAGDRLLREMADDGLIEIRSEAIGPFQSAVYTSIGKEVELTEGEQQAVQAAVHWIQNRSASELSDLTHSHSRSWIEGADGDILDIYEDNLDDAEARRIATWSAQAEEALSQIFKS